MCSISFYFIFYSIAALLLSCPGNIFILLLNVMNIIKLKQFHLSDQLIFSITVVDTLHQLLYILELIVCFVGVGKLSTDAANLCFLLLFMTAMSCKIWLSTWLCVHFCVKIVNINQRFYIYLQKTFPRKFKWILGLTVLGSLLLSFQSLSVNLKLPLNHSIVTLGNYKPYQSSNELFCSAFSVAFVILFASALTIIISLCRHMKSMQVNANGSRSANVEAHVRATKTILSLLVINIFLLISSINWFFATILSGSFEYIALIFLALCHILNPLILIKGNNKLYKVLRKLLRPSTQN